MQQLDELLNSWLDNELMSDGKNKQHLAGWLKTNHNRLGSEWRIWWLWWVWWVWRVWGSGTWSWDASGPTRPLMCSCGTCNCLRGL